MAYAWRRMARLRSSPAVRRQTPFIDRGGRYSLPRPSSVGAGMARHRWFAQWAGETPFDIASPTVWQQEADRFGVLVLREHEDGTFSVVPMADCDTDKG